MKRALRWMWASEGSLSDRVLRGGAWQLAGAGASRVAGLAKYAVLAHLLDPRDFGVMGVAMLVLRWLEFFTETGLHHALVQRAGEVRHFLPSVWGVKLIRCAALAVVVAIGAPWVGAFFESPDSVPIVRMISVVILLRALENPAIVFLPKELDFRRSVEWRLWGEFAGLVTALALAMVWPDVRALVGSVIASQFARSAISWRLADFRPRVEFEWDKIRDLLGFGKWMLGWNVVNFFDLYIDSVVVGKVLGTTALGFYQMSAQFALVPTSEVGELLRGVLFPAFAKLQASGHAVSAFLRSTSAVSAVALPMGAVLIAYAEPAIAIGLGARWLEITECFRWLAVAGVATTLGASTNALFQGVGRPGLSVGGAVVKVAVGAALLGLWVPGGSVSDAALAMCVASLTAMAFRLVVAARLLDIGVGAILFELRTGAAMAGAVAVVAWVWRPEVSEPWFAVASGATAMVAAAAVLAAAFRAGWVKPPPRPVQTDVEAGPATSS